MITTDDAYYPAGQPRFDAADWYWMVGGDDSRFWSSAAASYVEELPEGAGVTRIADEAELAQVLVAHGLSGPISADPPLELVRIASARLTIDGFDVTSIDRTQGMSLAFVADTDTVWVFFDEPQPDTEYLVAPIEGVTKYADHIEVTRPGLAALSLIVQRII